MNALQSVGLFGAIAIAAIMGVMSATMDGRSSWETADISAILAGTGVIGVIICLSLFAAGCAIKLTRRHKED